MGRKCILVRFESCVNEGRTDGSDGNIAFRFEPAVPTAADLSSLRRLPFETKTGDGALAPARFGCCLASVRGDGPSLTLPWRHTEGLTATEGRHSGEGRLTSPSSELAEGVVDVASGSGGISSPASPAGPAGEICIESSLDTCSVASPSVTPAKDGSSISDAEVDSAATSHSGTSACSQWGEELGQNILDAVAQYAPLTPHHQRTQTRRNRPWGSPQLKRRRPYHHSH